MVRLGQRGVADILAVAFMMILLVIGAGLMHAYSLRPLHAAADRQMEMKCEHLYKTLDTAWTDPYSIPILEAAAEQLILDRPTVPDAHLRSYLAATLDYLGPPGFAVSISLTRDGRIWEFVYPDGSAPGPKQFIRRGTISIIKAGGGMATVRVSVAIFKPA